MFSQHFIFILSFSLAVLLQINGIWADGFAKDVRIINGTVASLNATRHQVSIRRRSDEKRFFGNGHTCGGSLISENLVLTAAHCFINVDKGDGSFLSEKGFVVVLGNLDRLKNNSNTLVFDIMRIVQPAHYFNLKTLEDDIALVVLNGTVPAKHPNVKPIVLNDGRLKNNTMCQATGWGINEDNVRSDKLRTVDLPLFDANSCREKTIYGPSVREGMICAGYLEGKRGPCTADSGGPLVCKGIQVGIVSWGSGCAKPLSPTVFADVAHYKNWISNVVAYHNATMPQFASVPDGVTSLSCSIFLISIMLTFNFLYSQIK